MSRVRAARGAGRRYACARRGESKGQMVGRMRHHCAGIGHSLLAGLSLLARQILDRRCSKNERYDDGDKREQKSQHRMSHGGDRSVVRQPPARQVAGCQHQVGTRPRNDPDVHHAAHGLAYALPAACRPVNLCGGSRRREITSHQPAPRRFAFGRAGELPAVGDFGARGGDRVSATADRAGMRDHGSFSGRAPRVSRERQGDIRVFRGIRAALTERRGAQQDDFGLGQRPERER